MKTSEEVKKIIKQKIENVLKENNMQVDKVILFGSRAREDFSEKSDWDILLIIKSSITIEQKRKIAKAIRKELADKLIDVDVIIKSSREVDYYKDFIGTVTREALKEGILI